VEARQDRRRVKELERELHRKDKALAETAALLDEILVLHLLAPDFCCQSVVTAGEIGSGVVDMIGRAVGCGGTGCEDPVTERA
jgi:hypothetical protein